MPSEPARATLVGRIEGIFAGGLSVASLLSSLYFGRSVEMFQRFGGADDAGPDLRVDGGTQQIAERLAAELSGRVLLGSPVWHVARGPDPMQVETAGVTVAARRAIITLPPALAGRLRYTPALPAFRDQLTQRMPMSWLMKIHAVYPTPFWRADGLSGRVTTDATRVVQVTADNSPPSGQPGILVALIKEDAARSLERMAPAERRTTVLSDLARYFGDQAATAIAYQEKSWGADEWTRGVYGGFLAPGVRTACGGALREPLGGLHWAGTETAIAWNGKLEGALVSGERAAAEVLATLG